MSQRFRARAATRNAADSPAREDITVSEATLGLAIVTGASSGIGLELARQLAREGRPVLAVARREDRLLALAAEAKAAGAAPVFPLAVDLASEGAPDRVRASAASHGPVEWLVNNAGAGKFAPALQVPREEQVKEIRTMCEAVVALTATFLPEMVARRRGVVLNVASAAGFQPTPQMAVYGAAKAFVLSYSEAMAVELRGTGVTVTAFCPGPVTTEFFDHAAPGVPRKKPARELTAEECARLGIEAAKRGKVVAVPGLPNKLTAVASQLAPRGLVRWATGKMGLTYLGYPPPGRN